MPGKLQADQSGAVGVTFSIYRDQFDGAALWSEVQNVQADKKGGYSVLLGSARNEGLPMELFNTTESRWLEAEVNGVKEPRVRMGSVPYAMVAENAQTLGGLPPSAYLRVAPDSTLGGVDRATTTVTAVPFKPQVTSGTGGYLAVFTNATDLGNSVLFQNGNAISIGGTTSLGAMTLIGNAPGGDTAGMALSNSGGGAGASVSLDMYNTSFNGGIPQAKIKALDDGAYSDHLTFLLKNPGAPTNPVVERMRIASNGNVGIGTTTPGSKLEVAGSLKISGMGNGIVFPDGTTMTTGVVSSYGNSNTAFGQFALTTNTSGGGNTAAGAGALEFNTTGSGNTAIGIDALVLNTVGSSNTAVGVYALGNNIVGNEDVALGFMALGANGGGSTNTATGARALMSNTNGNGNTANGNGALYSNTLGNGNTAIGLSALRTGTTGSSNTAVGNSALNTDTTGSSNTAVGYYAGTGLTVGNYNIAIGNSGLSSDDHVIRIGDVQTATYVAGISGANVSGVPVIVSSTGQLGIASSSRRFKEDIQDMGEASDKIMHLRPVTYHYKQPYEDGSKPLDYGLIAEEVAEVYPDLVAHSLDGQIQTVMYQKLTPMLLNEVQRLRSQNASQNAVIRAMEERLARLEAKQ